MANSTITAKGQTTVLLDIRLRIGARAGTRLAWLMAALDTNVLVRFLVEHDAALSSAAGEAPSWTFDKAAPKIAGARRVRG